MQKIYWWRVILTALLSVVLISLYFVPCGSNLNVCFWGNDMLVVRTLFHFSLAAFIVSSLLFFIQDAIFVKWLKFAIGWFVIAAILIAIAPVYSGGFVGFGPTKESVSIWMSSLFVLLSLILIVRESKKAKN